MTYSVDLRFRLRHRLLNSPPIARRYMRRRQGYGPLVPNTASQVVIDGFPRSANSYAMFAFVVAAGSSVGFSGHTHSPEALLMGRNMGIPALLTLRRPEDCARSLLQHQTGIRPDSIFDAWSGFHQPFRQNCDGILIVPFEAIVQDFGQVLALLNSQTPASLPVYDKTEGNEAKVRTLIDHSVVKYEGAYAEAKVARPVAGRVSDLSPFPDTRAFRRALKIYQELFRLADTSLRIE